MNLPPHSVKSDRVSETVCGQHHCDGIRLLVQIKRTTDSDAASQYRRSWQEWSQASLLGSRILRAFHATIRRARAYECASFPHMGFFSLNCGFTHPPS
jgi:hypothetical protein